MADEPGVVEADEADADYDYDAERSSRKANLLYKRHLMGADGGRKKYVNSTLLQRQMVQALYNDIGSPELTAKEIDLVWPATYDPPPNWLVRLWCEQIDSGHKSVPAAVQAAVSRRLKNRDLWRHREVLNKLYTRLEKETESEDGDYKMINAAASGISVIQQQVITEQYGPRRNDSPQAVAVGTVNLISNTGAKKQRLRGNPSMTKALKAAVVDGEYRPLGDSD